VQGLIEDDSFMFVDYGIDDGDDPFSEETWKKANPNYGISIERFQSKSSAQSSHFCMSKYASTLVVQTLRCLVKNSFKNDTSFCAFLAVRLNVSGSIFSL
jgi:hypothetical protein